MKKAACFLLSLLLLLSLVACGNQEDPAEAPETPNTQTPVQPADPAGKPAEPQEPAGTGTESNEPDEPVDSDDSSMYTLAADPANDLNMGIYVGRYHKEDPGEAEAHYLEVRNHGDFMTLEHCRYTEGGAYSFWVEEFWPNEDETYTDLYDWRSGMIQTFSAMTTMETYDDLPSACAIAYTDAGICISRGGEREHYIIGETPSLNTPAEELREQLLFMEDGTTEGGPIGHYRGWSAQIFTYAEFNEDGSFYWLSKSVNKPVVIYRGVWLINPDNALVVMAERLGEGTMPYLSYIEWTYDAAEAGLSLQEAYVSLLRDGEGFCYLTKCDGDVYIPFYQEVALDFNGWYE